MSIDTSSPRPSRVGLKKPSARISLPSLRLQTSERKLLLITMDLLLVSLALVGSLLVGWEQPITAPLLIASFKWFHPGGGLGVGRALFRPV